MSYTPTTWNTGDTVTASAMNKIENGIANAGSALIINCTIDDGNYVLDKTYAEIYDAIINKIPCYISDLTHKYSSNIDTDYAHSVGLAPITFVYKYNDTYRMYAAASLSSYFQNTTLGTPAVHVFGADTSTDYPIFIKSVYVSNNYLATLSTPW